MRDESRGGRLVLRDPEGLEQSLKEGGGARHVEDGFHLIEEIGRGGMGSVHRADDRLLGRSVAVKVLPAGEPSGAAVVRRFVVEAQLGAQLEHPNIVPFYELLSTATGQPAFAVKLIEGETMADDLLACSHSPAESRTPPHDLHSRLERFLKVCDAIEYAHARGVVHRDLKPRNVMFGRHHEVYVMDWGVARVISESGPPVAPTPAIAGQDTGNDLTATGEIFGSPGYMSPEQARSEPATPACDQYSLALMLAELVTLEPARRGTVSRQISAAMTNLPLKLAHRFGDPVPRALAAIIKKGTATAAAQRYRSVADFAADVRRFTRDEAVSVLPEPFHFAAWRWMKHRPLVVLSVLSGLGFLVALSVVLGLVRELGERERAARGAARIFTLTSSVSRAVHDVDAHLQRIELLVEGLASAAQEILRAPPETSPAPLAPLDLAPADSSARWVDRYQQRVTFERAVAVSSPGASLTDLARPMGRLGAFEQLLLTTSARAATSDEVLAAPARERAEASGRSPVLWTDLAFTEGLILVYPGNTYFPPDYEPRKRSWYLAALAHAGEVWGAPYADATSGQLLVPCSRAFYGEGGSASGVAAAHLRLDDVLDSLVVPGIEGYQGSALVDRQGEMVLTTQARGVRLSTGVHENREVERRPFPVPNVRRMIAENRGEGRVIEGGSLYVVQRLSSARWWIVVTVDEDPYSFVPAEPPAL